MYCHCVLCVCVCGGGEWNGYPRAARCWLGNGSEVHEGGDGVWGEGQVREWVIDFIDARSLGRLALARPIDICPNDASNEQVLFRLWQDCF